MNKLFLSSSAHAYTQRSKNNFWYLFSALFSSQKLFCCLVFHSYFKLARLKFSEDSHLYHPSSCIPVSFYVGSKDLNLSY